MTLSAMTLWHITHINKYTTLNLITMIKEISFKIDNDNDLYEITIDNKTYNLDTIYDSKYGELFDELNILIDSVQ